ncbi:MAG: hypothetical protein ACLRS8_06885 [Parabacteroides merdae]
MSWQIVFPESEQPRRYRQRQDSPRVRIILTANRQIHANKTGNEVSVASGEVEIDGNICYKSTLRISDQE